MIECHALIFLDHGLLQSPFAYRLQDINGLVSAAFLFSAGFAAALVGSRSAGDPAARRRRSKRTLLRLAQVLVMALYFHHVCAPIYTQPATLLRVDILLCIAIGVLIVWGVVTLCRGNRQWTVGLLLAMTFTVALITPWAWQYRGGVIVTELLNGSNGSMFPLCPWLMYPLLGASIGVFAAHPTRGRAKLFAMLAATLVIAAMLASQAVASNFWSHFSTGDGQFWIRNAMERVWKLSLTLLVLLVIDSVSRLSVVAKWTRLFSPIDATLNFFSRNALVAYLVHLSLLFGFLTWQPTVMWHGKSSWAQYGWRLLFVISATAVICQLLHLTRMLIDVVIRTRTAPADPSPIS